ncbi:hypothetical protein K2X33_04545 [bacterium]|nr:hypothetical protein [bacterium]
MRIWAFLVFSFCWNSFGADLIQVTERGAQPVVLGLSQPDGSVYYFDRGIRRVTEKIRETLVNRAIPGNFAKQINDYEYLRGVSFQLGRHLIPEEIVPAPLREIGVNLTHFVLPDKELTPDALEKSYLENKANKKHPLKDVAAADFVRLHQLYARTYDLPFFPIIREAVKQDGYYSFGRSALSWSVGLLEFDLFLITGRPISAFWKNLLGSRALGMVASTLTFVLPYSFIERVSSGIVDRKTPQDLDELYNLLAKASYGEKGVDYLNANRQAITALSSNADFPSFAAFVRQDEVAKFLLNPTHYYDLVRLEKNLRNVDKDWLASLKQRDAKAIDRLMERLEPPAGHEPFARLREIVEKGTASALWCELAVLALQNDRQLAVTTEKSRMGLAAHSSKGEIGMKDTEFFHPNRSSAVLGHEFWHRAKVSYRDAEIFRYYDLREYAHAFAAEEVLAILSEAQMMREMAEKDATVMDEVRTAIEKVNPTKYELVLALMGSQQLKNKTATLTKYFRSHHWLDWRGHD